MCMYVHACVLGLCLLTHVPVLLSDCKEPFMGNFTFEVPRSIGSGDASVGSVASPYQMYFK